MSTKGEFFRVAKLIASEYPVVEGTRCVQVQIPDDVSFLPVLASLVAQMGNTWASVGTVEQRRAWSQMWQEAYAATDWEGCMSCEEVADCIENDDEVRDQIIDIVNDGTEIPATYPYGQNLPSSRRNQDLSTPYNPTCNLDILFGQCYGVVDTIDSAIKAVLAKIEQATNAVELAQAMLGTVPVVAGAEKAAGIDGALSLINYFQETVEENYAGQFTVFPGGVRDEIACAIFCECKEDCVITINRLEAVMSARLSVYIAPPSIEGFVNLIEALAGINVDTTYVVDLAFYVSVGTLMTGNYLFGGVANNVLDLVIKLKADEPSNDWEILCPCSDVCRLTLDYDNQPADMDIDYGTLDPGGFMDSGVLDSTAWIIFGCEQPIASAVRIRLVYDSPTIEGCQVYGDTFFFATGDHPVRINLTEFAITLETGVPTTGNIVAINTRQVIGDLTPFKLLRIEVVYEC